MLVFRKLYRYTVILLDIVSGPNILTKTYINDISIGFMIENSFHRKNDKHKILLYCGRNNIAIKYLIMLGQKEQYIHIHIFICQYKIKLNQRMLQFIDDFNNIRLCSIYNYTDKDRTLDHYSIEYCRDNFKKLKV